MENKREEKGKIQTSKPINTHLKKLAIQEITIPLNRNSRKECQKELSVLSGK